MLNFLQILLGGVTQREMIQSRINLIQAAMVASLILAVLKPTPSAAQVVDREAELKGKLVGAIGGLVTWPNAVAPSSTNPLTIGILGTNPFVDNDGVNHLQRKLQNVRIVNFADSEAIGFCHILVVAKEADFKAAIANARKRPILIVAESPGLARQGAAVNVVFDEETNKIRLEINPKAAAYAGLRISRNLLRSPLVDIIQ